METASVYDVTIPNKRTRREEGSGRSFTEYEVLVQTRTHRWAVHHRFKEFRELFLILKDAFASELSSIEFPARQIFGSTDPSTVELRRLELQLFLRHCLAVLPSSNPHLKQFLDLAREADPKAKIAGILRPEAAPVAGSTSAASSSAPLPRSGYETIEDRDTPSHGSANQATADGSPDASDRLHGEELWRSGSHLLPQYTPPSPSNVPPFDFGRLLSETESGPGTFSASSPDPSHIGDEVDEKLTDFYDILDKSQLTQSQEQRLHVYLGNITELRHRLTLLIEAHLAGASSSPSLFFSPLFFFFFFLLVCLLFLLHFFPPFFFLLLRLMSVNKSHGLFK
eukprot:TRINITY_DN366_c1_g1_i2.p1 TRINITY_DN366_c1_g1~~TRINITY_DN366_c1_g1_i2.p1  ORF type:complete len:339 (+),score=71.60 TRINITY_DN366_c1_g1_i2:306-1322(+)